LVILARAWWFVRRDHLNRHRSARIRALAFFRSKTSGNPEQDYSRTA